MLQFRSFPSFWCGRMRCCKKIKVFIPEICQNVRNKTLKRTYKELSCEKSPQPGFCFAPTLDRGWWSFWWEIRLQQKVTGKNCEISSVVPWKLLVLWSLRCFKKIAWFLKIQKSRWRVLVTESFCERWRHTWKFFRIFRQLFRSPGSTPGIIIFF